MSAADSTGLASDAKGQNALRERIMGAAFHAFMAEGYAGTSTLKIATRAKVSKRELYALFGSKQEILRACIAMRARRMTPPEPPPTPATREALTETLAQMGARLFEALTHPQVVAMHRLAVEEAFRSPEIGEALEAVRRQTAGSVAELIARAQGAGVVAPGEPLALARDYQALLMHNTLLRLMQQVEATPDADHANARARHAADAFVKLYGRG